MSREKDSEIVYNLVTSKYKIADRNRIAKLRFLNAMKSGPIKRRDSEPSMANVEKTSVERVDISVPGTPVSSRYVQALRYGRNHIDSDSETENEVGDAIDKPKYQSVLHEGLKKFTADMEKLQDEASHDPLQKYFHDSDKKKTYRRDFSEVVSEFPSGKKEPETIAKVEKYFQESERMNSFKRDFTEVVRTFDPKNPTGREQFTDLMKVGTPISSRLVAVEKLSSAIEYSSASDDIKSSSELVENDKKVQVHLNSNGNGIHYETNDVVQNGGNEHTLKIIEEETVNEILVTKEETQPTIDPPKRLNRADSNVSNVSNVSVPGTPISSRDLSSLRNRNLIDTDDSGSEDDERDDTFSNKSAEIKALAQEFVHEIENLVQKSFDDDDRQGIVLEELKKLTTEIVEHKEPTAKLSESDEKLIIHEQQQQQQQVDSNPGGSGNKVVDYFEMSKRDNTYTRTFSEAANFNEASRDVKQKVENYFRESEQKKSLTRPFSQAINYVEPKVNVEKLLKPGTNVEPKVVLENLMKPGTPVSSAVVCQLREQSQLKMIEDEVDEDPETLRSNEVFKKAHEALHGKESGKETISVDDYFKQSQERNTYRRNFSEVLEQLNKTQPDKNPQIEKYFEQSDAQQAFQRPFSEVFQSVPPRIEDILKVEEKVEVKPQYKRSSRASSVSSNCSDLSEDGQPRKSKKHGKKYGIDKYFATSLYRTAYHRSNSRRQSKDGEAEPADDLKIVEDEDVFGETDMLRQQEYQHDDETRVTNEPNDVNENQTVHFWRDFLKPYNLNLQTEISVTKDDLLNNRTLE